MLPCNITYLSCHSLDVRNGKHFCGNTGHRPIKVTLRPGDTQKTQRVRFRPWCSDLRCH